MKKIQNQYGISTELILPIIILALSIVFAVPTAIANNPDSDAFFLIEHGRYIMENGFPTTNPWYGAEGLGIIIQQPGCSILNYIVYKMGGLNNLWLLAMTFFLIMGCAAYRFIATIIDNKYRRLLVLGTFLLLAIRIKIINTRSYQLTIALSLLTLTALIVWHKSNKTRTDTLKLILKLVILSFIQANFQMSFTVNPFLWTLCFTAPDIFKDTFKIQVKNIQKQQLIQIGKECVYSLSHILLFFTPMFIATTLNPYGIRGSLYMFHARDALKDCKNLIQEIKSPEIISPTIFLISITAIAITYLFHKKKLEAWILYLTLGTSILASITYRCLWMLFLPAMAAFSMLPTVEENKESKRVLCLWVITPAVLITSVCIGIKTYNHNVYEKFPEAAVEYLQRNHVNEVIYTDFNEGAGLIFEGFQIVGMDARPDIYTTDICGQDIIGEWMEMYTCTEPSKIEEYLSVYNVNYFVTQPNSPIAFYMECIDKYQKVAEDSFCKLFVKVE